MVKIFDACITNKGGTLRIYCSGTNELKQKNSGNY